MTDEAMDEALDSLVKPKAYTRVDGKEPEIFCTMCGKLTPLSGYYIRGNGMILQWCKECRRGLAKAKYTKTGKPPGRPRGVTQRVCLVCGGMYPSTSFPEIKRSVCMTCFSHGNKTVIEVLLEQHRCVCCGTRLARRGLYNAVCTRCARKENVCTNCGIRQRLPDSDRCNFCDDSAPPEQKPSDTPEDASEGIVIL